MQPCASSTPTSAILDRHESPHAWLSCFVVFGEIPAPQIPETTFAFWYSLVVCCSFDECRCGLVWRVNPGTCPNEERRGSSKGACYLFTFLRLLNDFCYNWIIASHDSIHISVTMDAPEPDTPFSAVTAQTSKYGRVGARGDRLRFAAEANATQDIPILSRQVNAICLIPMDWHRRSLCALRSPDPLRARLVYR